MIFYSGNFDSRLQYSLMCAVSILTIACPCALVLATPITLTVGMGRASQLGIIIRDGAILEKMLNIKHVVFDKTGTLTKSNLDENADNAKILRPDAAKTISELSDKFGIDSYILSGDKEEEAYRIADEVGIEKTNVVYGATPLSKKEYFLSLKNKIKDQSNKEDLFAYVGDGINDAPAMASADVSVTLISATDIALESGDVVLMRNKLNDLITAIRISGASMRKIKQNLF